MYSENNEWGLSRRESEHIGNCAERGNRAKGDPFCPLCPGTHRALTGRVVSSLDRQRARPTRPIGSLTVSALGLGVMPLSMGRTPAVPREQGIETVHAALDAGITLLDTADIYAPSRDTLGHHEELVAEALAAYPGSTADVVLATKGGITRGEGETWGRDGSPAHLRSALEASLARLGLAAVQNQFSPSFHHTSIRELRRCEEHGIAFVPWSPLGGIGGGSAGVGERYRAIGEAARAHGVSPQQVTLAWELSLGERVVPISGAGRPASILDSAGAMTLRLEPAELEAIGTILEG